jgi:uncharacterized membrane protein
VWSAPLYLASVVLHVLAAMVWLGGTLSLVLVGAPVLRAVEPPEVRQRLFDAIGRRLRRVGWSAVALLVMTGLYNTWVRGWLRRAVLADAAFWRTDQGRTFGVKLVAVGLMLVVGAVHDLVDGPAAGRAVPGSPESVRLRRRARLLARVDAALGLVVIVSAVLLARGR